MADAFGDRLAGEVRTRRAALGLTQQDLADMAGVSERFVRFVEQGKPSVQLDSLLAVLDTLGLELRITTTTSKGARALAGHASGQEPQR
ncbi:transcriptional regulator [Arthrobacter sp. AQ5-06]|nr:transcriptional regulator [Arthrobacter sp. AQ5-06]